jgi:hypothetical protein
VVGRRCKSVSQQFGTKGNNEEHEKATRPIARSGSHPWAVKHTSPCLTAICEVSNGRARGGGGSIYERDTLGYQYRQPILTVEVVVTTIAVAGAASGCPSVMMRFCAPEIESMGDVVRQVRVR